jgi:hypothetical protein
VRNATGNYTLRFDPRIVLSANGNATNNFQFAAGGVLGAGVLVFTLIDANGLAGNA